MGFYQLIREQQINASIEDVWNFIASPGNLKQITPGYMGFEITSSEVAEKMYPGMIICYRVSPFKGIRMKWVTEITHVKDNHFFVDEQRIGPYSLWHHQHILEENESGVLMKDIVSYRLPFGFIGSLAHHLFVKKQLREIFDFRVLAVERIFHTDQVLRPPS